MGRRRAAESDLPKCVYLRHGAYYFVRKGIWTRLCERRVDVEGTLESFITSRERMGQDELTTYCYRVMVRAGCNARGRRRNMPFDLSRADVLALLERARWTCEVTGTHFSLDKVGHRGQRPYAPSIDRVDSSEGYSFGNCRVVCVAANIAMNSWGDAVLLTMFRAWQRKEKGRGIGQSIDSAENT